MNFRQQVKLGYALSGQAIRLPWLHKRSIWLSTLAIIMPFFLLITGTVTAGILYSLHEGVTLNIVGFAKQWQFSLLMFPATFVFMLCGYTPSLRIVWAELDGTTIFWKDAFSLKPIFIAHMFILNIVVLGLQLIWFLICASASALWATSPFLAVPTYLAYALIYYPILCIAWLAIVVLVRRNCDAWQALREASSLIRHNLITFVSLVSLLTVWTFILTLIVVSTILFISFCLGFILKLFMNATATKITAIALAIPFITLLVTYAVAATISMQALFVHKLLPK